MAYSKLHSSVVNSSLWCAPDPVRLLFVTFLAICDADGCVYGSRGGIARQANIQYPQLPDPFDTLMQPDLDSSDLKRNPANKGRRIIEIEGGFQLINYSFYRGLRNADDRKLQNREAQQRFRARHKPPSAGVSHGKPRSAYAEAEAEAEAEKNPPTSLKGEPNCPHWRLSEKVTAKFRDWIEFRRGMGKKPKSWDKLFDRQAEWLRQFNVSDQLEILDQSMRNCWQGLFEPKRSNGQRRVPPAPPPQRTRPTREPTDEEFKRCGEVARAAMDDLRKKLHVT